MNERINLPRRSLRPDTWVVVPLYNEATVIADVVFGSRFLDDRTKPSKAKRLLLRAAVAYTNMTTKMRLTDAHNGLRAMNRAVAERLDIRQNRMAHASEIVEQIGSGGFRYTEHPVHIIYTDYSRSKGQSMLNSVNILTEMFFK